MLSHLESAPAHILPADPDAYVRPAEAARYLGIGKSTLWRWIADGKLERPRKMGATISVFTAGYIRQVQRELTESGQY